MALFAGLFGVDVLRDNGFEGGGVDGVVDVVLRVDDEVRAFAAHAQAVGRAEADARRAVRLAGVGGIHRRLQARNQRVGAAAQVAVLPTAQDDAVFGLVADFSHQGANNHWVNIPAILADRGGIAAVSSPTVMWGIIVGCDSMGI